MVSRQKIKVRSHSLIFEDFTNIHCFFIRLQLTIIALTYRSDNLPPNYSIYKKKKHVMYSIKWRHGSYFPPAVASLVRCAAGGGLRHLRNYYTVIHQPSLLEIFTIPFDDLQKLALNVGTNIPQHSVPR